MCSIVLYNHMKNKKMKKIFRAIKEKSPKNNIFQNFIPHNPRRIFSEKRPCEFWDLMVYYLYAKNQKNP